MTTTRTSSPESLDPETIEKYKKFGENNRKMGKKYGKIVEKVDENGKKVLYFSPNCCYNPKNPDQNLHPLPYEGLATIDCSCGRVYRVLTTGRDNDFHHIKRTLIKGDEPSWEK